MMWCDVMPYQYIIEYMMPSIISITRHKIIRFICDVMWCHWIMWCHVMSSCYVMSLNHVMSCDIMSSCDVMWCDVLPCHWLHNALCKHPSPTSRGLCLHPTMASKPRGNKRPGKKDRRQVKVRFQESPDQSTSWPFWRQPPKQVSP